MSGTSKPDLPLLDWQPPPKVVVFPMTRRLAKIRHTANLLSAKHGVEVDLYWRQVLASLNKSLSRLGVNDAEKRREIEAFKEAVVSELLRRQYSGRQPGGIA